MEILVLVTHVFAALAVIGLVLLQHGKGADVGAAFGSGSAGSVFGSAGSANFLSRATAILAVIFFVSSLGLTYLSARRTEQKGVMAAQPVPTKSVPSDVPVPSAPAGPAAPGAPSETGSKAGEIPK